MMSFQNSLYTQSGQTLTKASVKDMLENNQEALVELVAKYKNNAGALIYILESLGYIPRSADVSFLEELTMYCNDGVRFLAVKNLGKLKSRRYMRLYYEIYKNDTSTTVRREAVSSIGRIAQPETIPYLIEVLKNDDPKIVCQAIRGLLQFKGEPSVVEALKGLRNHENEMIRDVIHKEFGVKEDTKAEADHPSSYDFLKNVVVEGDVRGILTAVPDESFHLTFTSPPYYNARDYSIYPSYEAYLDFLSEVFKEVYRTTKDGRFLIVNTSPVIVPRISRSYASKRYPIPFDLHARLANMGWEFIDDIVWMKPEYSVKNRVGGFQQHRKPLAYKPNAVTEYLMVYRKKTDKLLDWNMRQYDKDIINQSKVDDGFETTNVWQISPKSDKVHSAVFPEELCEKVIKYYSYVGDLVFDPFAGSGTFGRVANRLDRYFFMTEKEPTFIQYIKETLTDSLFSKRTSFFSTDDFKGSVTL